MKYEILCISISIYWQVIPATHEKLIEIFNKDDSCKQYRVIFVRTILSTDNYITLEKLIHIFFSGTNGQQIVTLGCLENINSCTPLPITGSSVFRSRFK